MTPALEIEVSVEAGGWAPGHAELAATVLRNAIVHCGAGPAGPAEVSVLLTDDAAQRALNHEWRGKDASTNVLSFAQIGPGEPVIGLIGDISLAYETLVSESKDQDKPFEAHFAHLLVHGLLHILGHDHQSENDALAMEARETDIMKHLGYPDPYEGTDPVSKTP